MRRLIGLLAAIGLTLSLTAVHGVAAAPGEATCLVCKVMKGEAHEEPVKAVRTYEGKEYGFCSEKCAESFMTDAAAFIPPVFPRESPGFSLTDLQGRPVSNKALAGSVVLLDFWATWCAPCRKSMPDLQALHEKYSSRGFRVVGISIDKDGPAKVKRYVVSKKFSYPIALDSDQAPAWDAFRVKAVPAAFLLDRDGRIVAQWTGAPVSRDELESKLDALLGAATP